MFRSVRQVIACEHQVRRSQQHNAFGEVYPRSCFKKMDYGLGQTVRKNRHGDWAANTVNFYADRKRARLSPSPTIVLRRAQLARHF
jgi:hypothetical protein